MPTRLFRDRLLALGREEGEDFEYVELSDEGHGSSDIAQKIRTFRILGDYLERVPALRDAAIIRLIDQSGRCPWSPARPDGQQEAANRAG